MDLAIPDELMVVTFPFSQNQIQQTYPLVHSFEPHARDYLPAVYFFNRCLLVSKHSRATLDPHINLSGL